MSAVRVNNTFARRSIDSDQGALGGNTVVNVYENSVINVIIFRMEKKPQRVYPGEWGTFLVKVPQEHFFIMLPQSQIR